MFWLEMKILTLNTWQERGPWEERWEITLEGIQEFQPDLVAFQELFNHDWAGEIQKRTAFKTLIFPQEYCGLVLYSHFAVKSWGIIRLSQSPLEEYFRYSLWAELQREGASLFIFNTHLSWKLEDGATRQRQVEEILHLIQEKAGEKESVLVGDLNAPPHSPEIQGLIRKGQFCDCFAKLHPQESGFSWNNRNPYAAGAGHDLPDRRIDYILALGAGRHLRNLVSCDLIFTEPNAQGVWASDHAGLLAEFR